ncbi:MAG: 1-deoxy-D-xylulose-5-phosphate reductoisomerase [Lachnospiraceae bacterium]|nr:1-deoxy-D-xylulose-5-phosphate reductoisomerase [Lachnospiraceae bacterium]
MKRIALLGSTGSIGTQTLEVVSEHADELRIVALAADKNVALMEQQIRQYQPEAVCMFREDAARDLETRVKDLPVRVFAGMEGLIALASLPCADIVLTAVVGMIGIRPTIAAIESGKDIALANKETLVCAGHIIMALAREHGVRILPVDSEHSAIWQCLADNPKKNLEKILITASGGPFRGKTRAALAAVRPGDALKHPNWQMGAKVTIDSASLINKGLEVMEARWLFDVTLDQIEVVVQPESIIHSMVQFVDGSVIAQLSVPTMKLPIQVALFYPQRRQASTARIDFAALQSISFAAPDRENFPGLDLALKAARAGGTMPTVFNAANECLVRAFLEEKIRFTDITDRIAEAMEHHTIVEAPGVDEILDAERETIDGIRSRVRL